MLIAICRRHFTSTRWLAKRTRFRNHPDPAQLARLETLDLASLHAAAANQPICIEGHGFNRTMESLLRAYAELHAGMRRADGAGTNGCGLLNDFEFGPKNSGAGDEVRTRDVQLGKLTFYH
jgi:hypothetical protein